MIVHYNYFRVIRFLIVLWMWCTLLITKANCQTRCYPDAKIPNQSSSARPSLAVFNGKIYMVHLGSGSNDIWFSSYDGNSWSPNVKIPNQTSDATPALAVYNNKLYMVHKGGASNDLWFSSYDGTSWTSNINIANQSTQRAPALAAYNGRLYMVHSGSSSDDIWFSNYDGNSWSTNVKIPNQSTQASPTMVAFNNKLYMVHIGSSSNTLYMSTFSGNEWSANIPLSGPLSKSTPTITVFNNNLAIIHVGDNSDNLWLSSFIGDVYQYDFQLVQTSSSNPVGAATLSAPGPDGKLHIVHTGNGNSDLYDCIMPVAPAKPGVTSFTNIAKRSVTINFQDNSDVEESYFVIRELVGENPTAVKEIPKDCAPNSSNGKKEVTIGCPPAGRSVGSIYLYTDNGLIPGVNYRYTIGEQNFGGVTYNDPKEVQTLSPQIPAAPSNLIVTASSANSISIQWKNNAATSGPYSPTDLLVSWSGPYVESGKQTLTNPAINSYPITGLIGSTPYTIKVVAYNCDGASNAATVIGTTQASQPPPATGYSMVKVFNCDGNQQPIHVWLWDKNLNHNVTWQDKGTVPTSWSNGSCSTDGQAKLTIPLQNGHTYELVAINCGDDSPDIAPGNCRALDDNNFIGLTGGPVRIDEATIGGN